MAGRIPTYEAQIGAQADRRVINTPVLNQDVGAGDALRSIGGAIDAGVELAARLDKIKQDGEVVKADRIVREKIDRLKFDLENASPDVPAEELKKKYQELSEAALQEAGKTVSNPRARDIFTERARGYQSDGALWTDSLGLKRGLDGERAKFVSGVAEIQNKVGDPAIPRDSILKDVEGLRAQVMTGLQKGAYSKERAAELSAILDETLVKDSTVRWSTSVLTTARAGAFDEATKMVAEAKDIDQPTKEDALSKIERERNKQEKDRAEKWQLAGNEYEIAILDGKGSRKDIDEGVKAGRFNPNDAPALIRMLREEDDRRKREAIASVTMSEAEKEAHRIQSADTRLSFEAVAGYDPATFMQPDKWSEDDQKAFYAMTEGDQRAIRAKINGMKINGATSDAKTKTFGALMDEAKRWAPPSWKLDTTKDGIRSWPRRALDSLLMKTAEEMAPQLGGNPMTQKQAQEIVGRVLSQIDPKADWTTIPSVAYNKAIAAAGLDPTWSQPLAMVDDRPGTPAYESAYNELKKRTGIEPSASDVQRLLAARSGQPAAKK